MQLLPAANTPHHQIGPIVKIKIRVGRHRDAVLRHHPTTTRHTSQASPRVGVPSILGLAWNKFLQMCCCSVIQLCPTLWDPVDCSTPSFHYLSEFAQTHVHQAGDAIQPSHPLSSPSPSLNLSQHQGLFKWVSFSHQVAKVSASTSLLPMNT